MLSSIIKSSSDFVIKRLVEFINWLLKKSSNSKYEKIQRNKTVQFNFNYSWLNIRELSSTVHLKIMFVSVLVVRGWDQASKLDSYSAGRSCGCRRIAAAVPVPGANTRSWCGTIPADSWPDAPTFSVSLHLLKRMRCRCRKWTKWYYRYSRMNWARLPACGSAEWRWLRAASRWAVTTAFADIGTSAPTEWCRSSTRRSDSTIPPKVTIPEPSSGLAMIPAHRCNNSRGQIRFGKQPRPISSRPILYPRGNCVLINRDERNPAIRDTSFRRLFASQHTPDLPDW